ncbi:serine/threonine-protein kinase [Gorillibacterium sp. sgz5001074]|uniref:serine/threonine protein kinase n=1 Tax=Gorillibacterium sp. sgz5001074 TaxID=3446695 RepID=UPI003F6616ED
MGQHSIHRWGQRLLFSRRFRTGRTLHNRYRILGPLGAGTYGFAYLCEDLQEGRRAVLKASAPTRGGRAKAVSVRRWETEALSQLDHPGIPKLYDLFDCGGTPCFTMELVEGDSLDALLFREGRRFTEEETLDLAGRLLPIIGTVHATGWVHRDISIANVMLVGDQVRLIDFGLARPFPTDTTFGQTPDDLEPDWPSFTRLKRQLHPAADLYALGHLLLFLLYSTYNPGDEADGPSDKYRAPSGWEEELTLTEGTRQLLRRLLLTEEAYSGVPELQADLERLRRPRHQ